MNRTIPILSAILLALFPVYAQTPVDLGLSVKWADRNVGASAQQEQGTLFAWGATSPVPYYDWSYYPFCGGNFNELTKYNIDPNLGTVDGKCVLEPEDDAANVIFGDGWRMPTDAEWKELIEECEWSIGRKGCTVRSRKPGFENSSIFLPFIAGKSGGEVYASSLGYYWSSTLCTTSCWSAAAVSFYNKTVERPVFGRYLGCAVRPVKK